MHSWQTPHIPVLPGTAPIPRLVDDSSGALRAAGVAGERATLYVCGITPYDATHLGHASTYLAFDTLNRLWRDAGLEVRYAQNVTDVDDPLLERATATGVDWRDLAVEQTNLFRSDMATLSVIPPDDYVAVTDVIAPIADAVVVLLERGFAYPADTPDAAQPGATDLYFDSAAAEAATEWFLGSESRLDRDTMLRFFAERGGDPTRAGKRNALDPLLWRVARDGEPSWPSAVGAGRPGWHIECSVIAIDALGEHITVQGGGSDLIFPHHEFSAAHATAITGKRFAEIQAHAGMVAYQGEKMSKSLGNLVLVSRLTAAGVDARAIRLAILAHHYRSDWEWTDAELARSGATIENWVARFAPVVAAEAEPTAAELDLLAGIRESLARDLDAPAAIDLITEWLTTNAPTSRLIPDALDALLGIRV